MSAYSSHKSALLGAAFLMATSAIGPGFITQTTIFTQQLLTSFGFVILISILLDIGAQLNIWRIIAVAEEKAPVVANKVLPGMGNLMVLLIVIGGLAFNIGNVAGAGLGINVIFGIDILQGAVISAAIALIIFWVKEAGLAMDWFAKILGIVMIGLTLYVAILSNPPVAAVIRHSFFPELTSATAIVTLVGGTVGGYISFSGAHRLLDAGIKGRSQLPQVNKSSINAILLASLMRILLFMAALGVVMAGGILNKDNPAASVFQIAAGSIGYKIFGIVLWSAAITSIVGSAYTSVSFLRSMHPWFQQHNKWVTTCFIIFSTLVFALVGKPVKVLVIVGALNGFILPIALGMMLVAAHQKKIIGTYLHPYWMTAVGWVVVAAMGILGIVTIVNDLGKLW
jgi:Mn2+/Fe2+ NRAMP family transporter